jgi:hypothetical protein
MNIGWRMSALLRPNLASALTLLIRPHGEIGVTLRYEDHFSIALKASRARGVVKGVMHCTLSNILIP